MKLAITVDEHVLKDVVADYLRNRHGGRVDYVTDPKCVRFEEQKQLIGGEIVRTTVAVYEAEIGS